MPSTASSRGILVECECGKENFVDSESLWPYVANEFCAKCGKPLVWGEDDKLVN